MTAALLLLRKVLALVPWWAWPVLALAVWGGWQYMRAERLQSQVDKAAAEHVARLAMAEETGRLLRTSAAQLKGRRDEDDKRTRSRYDADLRELRNRPDRLPAAAAATCQGASGAELSRRDAEFLTGFAARAQLVANALTECYGRIDDFYSSRPDGGAAGVQQEQ